MGEAYFLALADCLESGRCREKLKLLAEVEHEAARSIAGLLDKYALTPRPPAVLADLGAEQAKAHADMRWRDYLRFMIDTFPRFIDQFKALEAIAPTADKPALERLTEHEILTIEYARRALRDDRDSAAILHDYLHDTERARDALKISNPMGECTGNPINHNH